MKTISLKRTHVQLLLTPLLLLNFCSNPDKIINSEYANIDIETIEYQDENGNVTSYTWPAFHSENKKLEKKLNSSLSMETLLGSSLKEVLENNSTLQEENGIKEKLVETDFHVNLNDGFMLDLIISTVRMGAHENYESYHSRINLKTGNKLEINDLISEKYVEELISYCDMQIKKQADKIIFEGKAYDGIDLTKGAYGNIKFTNKHLNNFTLRPGGISFSLSVDLPEYLKAYDKGLICFVDFQEYGYLVKEGSILEEYVINNKANFETLANKRNENSPEPEFAAYIRVKTPGELKTALNNAIEGTAILIENDLNIQECIGISKSSVTLIGDRSKNPRIYIDDPEACVLAIYGCEDVTIDNLRFCHSTGIAECQASVIEIKECKNITVEHSEISGCGEIGLYIFEDAENITISDNKIYDCSHEGMIVYSPSTSIIRNLFYRNRDDHIIGSGIRKTVSLKDNVYYGWNSDYNKKVVDEILVGRNPVSRNYSNDYGEGNLKAFLEDDVLMYLKLNWEDDWCKLEMTAYFGTGDPFFVNQIVTCHDEMAGATDVFNLILDSGVDKFDNCYKEIISWDGPDTTVFEVNWDYRRRLNDFFDKWELIINENLVVEEVFTERFFNYQGDIIEP